MKFGVVVFPGSNCDEDMIHVLSDVMGQDAVKIWHKEESLKPYGKLDGIFIPGGFSYGDYLRSGAIARFSNIMKEVIEFANNGGYVWGICNGFQILCEAGLLPGALLRNDRQKFICKNIWLKANTNYSAITNEINTAEAIKIPIAHADGRYHASQEELDHLIKHDQILFQYCDDKGEVTAEANVNGSIHNIAGVCNEGRNVFGMMPHPERAAEDILGNTDGRVMFESLLQSIKNKMAA